jgi:hypothetical protein
MPTSLRYVTLFLCVLGMLVWLPWFWRNSYRRWYLVAPFTWIAHVIIYNVVRLLEIPIPVTTINIWSASITVHALLLIIGGGVVFVRRL